MILLNMENNMKDITIYKALKKIVDKCTHSSGEFSAPLQFRDYMLGFMILLEAVMEEDNNESK